MENPNPIEKRINNLKPEHLASGFESIMICVDDVDHYDDSLMGMAERVDYYKNESGQSGYFQAKDRGYVISAIDKESKYTDKLFCCTSIIAVGIDRETGDNISFLTHQDTFTINKDGNFDNDIKRRLEELKSRSVNGSMDIVLVGGNTDDEVSYLYTDTISKLSEQIEGVSGFKPVVVGPKSVGYLYDNVLFDTKNRRVYLMRPPMYRVHNDTFRSDDLDEVAESWGK